SRFFLNPGIVDLAAVPEARLDPALADEIAALARGHAALRTHDRIDYETVLPAKRRLLQNLFEVFYEKEWRADSRRAAEFREFLASDPAIRLHAIYEVLHEHFART